MESHIKAGDGDIPYIAVNAYNWVTDLKRILINVSFVTFHAWLMLFLLWLFQLQPSQIYVFFLRIFSTESHPEWERISMACSIVGIGLIAIYLYAYAAYRKAWNYVFWKICSL